jgi:putative two-component system response regulator
MQHGLQVLERLLSESQPLNSVYADVLIALVRAYDEVERPEAALKYLEMLLSHISALRAGSMQTLLTVAGTTSLARDLPTSTGNLGELSRLEQKLTDLKLKVSQREVAELRLEMLERLAVTADLKEDASGEHGYRVGTLARLLATDLRWRTDAVQSLELAARLHDLGKTGIPDRIVGSSETLKEAERQLMNKHTIVGAELLAKSNVPQLKMAEEIARHHHEWWDGSGYPDKLSGKRIPIHARIVALADVFDALTHGRPYAAPWRIDRALQEIRARRGAQFDPELTDRFLALIERLRVEHPDLDAYLGQAGANSPFRQARNRIRDLLVSEKVVEADVPVLVH